jgi:SulP family sulfate permease
MTEQIGRRQRMSDRGQLRRDVLAGTTTAAVVLPKAMAYATVAGLPVQVGLYTAFVPMAIYAALGTSRPLSVSTTSTIAILTAGALETVAGGNPTAVATATAALTALVGAMLLAAGLMRLGFLADFLSEPVLVGFKAGIGLVIVVDQIPKLLGIHLARGSFIHNVLGIARGVPEISLPTLTLGLVMILLLVTCERVMPRAPAPLIAIVGGILAVSLWKLQTHGVAVVGHIPRGAPAITVPHLLYARDYWTPALGIALMSFTESIAAGRAFLGDDETPPAANRELLALGLANAAGAFFGAMPSGGGTSQTAVNRHAGARSQLAALVTAGLALATMLLLSPIMALMPEATLGAIVVVYSIGMIEPNAFRTILNVRRTEFVWAVAAFLGVALLGTLKGIVVAIAVSLAALAYQVADPPVYVLGRKRGTNVFRPRSNEHPDDETFAGLLMLRLEGRVFFANAARIGQKILSIVDAEKPRVVALHLRGVPDLEYTALKMLIGAVQRQRERGIAVWLVGLNPAVLAVIQRSPLGPTLGREAMHFNLESAVAHYRKSAA